ncbi:hypothetical protein PF005_g25223 [Phytophthora fragariae]|uniref:RxLR effector protein n=3 Tax=Phytophthora fragariae TaxID=53985 RepID=A0A6A3QPV0_9STRA|nr:hypothetical protein PF009_g25334 [Phytophthora fragariae]KAE8971134.1 hypothetical protein PF011_g26151 [Phytophthora fragariae]KAE9074885.1 hypothetical protein PF010_g24509 [Phytophthora fragariae]KAE9080449.1 hypothetical protein PF007_g23046 [Phytophthora fragariae]KAE9104168.1 hypothetical protein PF006_g21979 [Phytophthora fragariae]
MSLLCVLGSVFLAFVAPIDAETLVTGSILPVSNYSVHTASGTSISTTRSLRTSAVVDDDDDAVDGGGDERTGLSIPFAEKAKTFFSPSKVSLKSLQKWLNEGKPADAAFTRLRLDKTEDWLLFHPQFTAWLKYVDDLSAKNPTMGTSAFSTLTAYSGDAALYKMIEDAAKVEGTYALATKLKKELMQHWITTAKASGDVFHAVNLDKVTYDILSNPKFTAWTKYVEDLNAKYPENPALMAPALRKYYSDEALLKMTDEVISGRGSKSVATKIQDELSQLWLSSRKTPDDASVELGLGRTVDTLMESPLFNIWLKYTNAYSTRYPQDKSTVIEALTRTFGDIEVAMMLQKPQTTDATRTIAKQLESAQLEMWWGSGKSVDDVLNLLDLRMNFQFTNDPLLNTWVSYIDRVLKENPGQATTLLTTLEPRFSEKALNQFLRAAMKFPSMEKTATTIQTKKIQGYVANNESPLQVFMWLDLDNVGDNLLRDPLFTKWMKYAKNFNQKNPKHQESWLEPIRMKYDLSV